jgi:hypothetical protein
MVDNKPQKYALFLHVIYIISRNIKFGMEIYYEYTYRLCRKYWF